MICPFFKSIFFSVSRFNQKKTSVSFLPIFPHLLIKKFPEFCEIRILERKTIPTRIPLRRNPSKSESNVTLKLPSDSKTCPDGDKSEKKVTERIITSDGTIRTRRHLTQAKTKKNSTKNQIVAVKRKSDFINFPILAL